MFTLLVTAAIALTLAYIALNRSRSIDCDQLAQPRATPLTMGVQIICGDCGGEGYQPKRTYLSRNGNCAQCGGSSYVLASIVACQRAQARAQRLREVQALSRSGRVIPFEAPGARAPMPERIAV